MDHHNPTPQQNFMAHSIAGVMKRYAEQFGDDEKSVRLGDYLLFCIVGSIMTKYETEEKVLAHVKEIFAKTPHQG